MTKTNKKTNKYFTPYHNPFICTSPLIKMPLFKISID